MTHPAELSEPDHLFRRTYFPYHAGDLVTTRQDSYPTLYEVLRVEVNGLLRVRCLNWAPGYSALVSADAVRPVSQILAGSSG